MTRLPTGFAIALGLALIVPLVNYYHPAPVGDFYGEWASVVFFAIAALFACRFLPQHAPLNVGLVVGPAILTVVILIQLALGVYTYAQDWVLWIAYLGLFTTAALIGQGALVVALDREVVSRLAWAFVVIALYSSFCQIVQLARAEDLFDPFVMPLVARSLCRPYGNIAQANHANTVAWLAIGSVLYLMQTKKLQRQLAAVLLGVFLLNTALTATRMAALMLGLTAAVVLIFRSWPAASHRERFTIAASLVGGVILASVLTAPLLQELDAGCGSTVGRLGELQRGDGVIRLELWRQALAAWRLNPILGGGANSFMGLAYAVQNPGVHEPLDAFAHNEALQLLVETGMIGAGAILLVVAGWLLALFRRRAELTPTQAVLTLWLGVLGIHSMLEFPLHYTFFMIPFGISVGLLLSPGWGFPIVRVFMRSVVAGLALLALVACAWLMNDFRSMERAVYLYELEKANGPAASPLFGPEIEKADGDVRFYRVYTDYFLKRRVPIDRQNISAKIESNAELLQRAPMMDVISRHVLMLAAAGNLEGARLHLQKLLMFYPHASVYEIQAIREFVGSHPADFPGLEAVVEDEVAHAPKARW